MRFGVCAVMDGEEPIERGRGPVYRIVPFLVNRVKIDLQQECNDGRIICNGKKTAVIRKSNMAPCCAMHLGFLAFCFVY